MKSSRYLLFFFSSIFAWAGTKSILLLNLDNYGGLDIVFERTNGDFEWSKNTRNSYKYWYNQNYISNGDIYPGIRILSDDNLSFLDSNLETTLIENLHSGNAFDYNFKYDSYYQPVLNKENLDRLNWFWGYNRDISNLSGIEEARNLKFLKLEESSVSDLTPLWSLTQLESLDISWGGNLTSIDGIKSLANLEYLDLSGQKIQDISELLQLNNLKLVELEENFIDLSDPSVQSTISQLRQKGAVVDIETQVPLSIQQLSTQMQLHLSQINASSDPKASFLYGFEMLLELFENTESSSLKMVAINGGAAQSLIDFTLPDLWRNDLNYDDSSELNSYADLNQLESYFYNVFIPRLTTINSHFSKMSAYNSTITLEQDFTGQEELITVDSGDAYALMAVVEALKGFLQVISSYDWDYNLKEINELDDNDLINLEALLDGSNSFGMLKSQNQLAEAKKSFKDSVSYYLLASDKMRTRLDQEMLFEMSSSDLADDDQLRSDLNEFLLALDNQHNLSDDSNNNQDMIYLYSLFDSKFDPVNSMPPVVGDKFESSDFKDPTLGGIMPNWNSSLLQDKLIEAELLANDVLEGSTAVSGASNWSQSNWLGAFYIPYKTSPNQFWMFHQNLKWVYLNSSSPSNIWLFFSSTGDWLWTKKSIYPYLYSNGLSSWLYLQTNGTLLRWNSSSWQNTSY